MVFSRSHQERVCFSSALLDPNHIHLFPHNQVEYKTTSSCRCVRPRCHQPLVTCALGNMCSEAVADCQCFIVTPPPSLQDSKTVPVPAHLIPLPDSRPSTPEPKVLLPDQSSSGALLPRNSGSNAKGTPNIMQDSGKKVALAESAFSFPPNIRLIIEPRSLSRPPPLLIQAGDAVVDERARKAFCASIHRPIVPLRSYIMPTPASFGESRETLEARRAELKRADYRFDQFP